MTPAASTDRFQTFRDPAGSLRVERGRVLRTVRPEYVDVVLGFACSEVGESWTASGKMVSSRIVQSGEDGSVLLEHPRIPFASYPWEWTAGQWIAAGQLTLDLCEELLDLGLILKDATPLNILFDGPQPVFVDVASVEKRDPASPLWLAYAQFVRTFLLPLAAHRYLGWPLAASLQRRDGYEPADLYPYLSLRQRWTRPLRSLVTAPYLLESQSGIAKPALAGEWRKPPEVAGAILRRNLGSLRDALRALSPGERSSRWSRYPQTASHYSEEDHAAKQDFVREALSIAQPCAVLDLGANTGTYSRIAAGLGARVVAWDSDVAACDSNWRAAKAQNLPIQVLVADVARPTPAAGWRNAEASSLLVRAQDQFDCVLMLGLLHHLLLLDQIPLEEVARLSRELTRAWLIVEWVPASDPRFQELLRGRDSLYGWLSEEAFLDAFDKHFSWVLRQPLKNGRVLFLLKAL